ncbi:hypothetical protein LPW36_15550 [Jinshanibacter sp. LJY008]|uniref:Uncharacterized protein n=1 Tax=Limnobaculum eriocheiris TaxID=2897391 RepID=A0A9X1MXG4_9GAMM|nr:hypothetical protein [Limnobaculum eriocheiris]MCD1127391.1 hypothetical protein [Limnobaculum eriocheiris]
MVGHDQRCYTMSLTAGYPFRYRQICIITIVTAAFALGIAPWLLSQTFSIFGIPVFPTLSALLVLGGIVWLAWRL